MIIMTSCLFDFLHETTPAWLITTWLHKDELLLPSGRG
jgi:hypothetical protein